MNVAKEDVVNLIRGSLTEFLGAEGLHDNSGMCQI